MPYPGEQASLKFLNFIKPLMRQVRESLLREIETLKSKFKNIAIEPSVIESWLVEPFAHQLAFFMSRTLTLELNVARLQGLLEGDTPEERFLDFINRSANSHVALSILHDYPVLARELVTRLENWLKSSSEFVKDLLQDRDVLQETFGVGNLDELVAIRTGLGDRHRGGRTVSSLTFGSGKKIIYKPRSLSIDAHFQGLLGWINQASDYFSFRTIKIVDFGNHGWTEFIEKEECKNKEEVENFYKEIGGYLALLYIFGSVDFHNENLIAAGEHPLLVDLETLFHPNLGGKPLIGQDTIAASILTTSVLRTGLLPLRSFVTEEFEGVDLSGIGNTEPQTAPFEIPYWDDEGTDEMHLRRTKTEITSQGLHIPELNNSKVDPLDYTGSILDGFQVMYKFLMENRNKLISKRGILFSFREDEIRVLLRPTKTYARMLFESYHPNLLRDALERDHFFDYLWSEVVQRPYLARIIPYEQENLWQGDIPFFRATIDSRDLWSSSNTKISNFFDETTFERLKRRLYDLSEQDLAKQVWFVRGSLTTLTRPDDLTRWHSGYLLPNCEEEASRDKLIRAAKIVGDRLDALALKDENGVAWIGLSTSHRGRIWTISPLRISLYDGLSGIALFLAYLGKITGEKKYTDLSISALQTIMAFIDESRKLEVNLALGAFNGIAGVIYTLGHISRILRDPDLMVIVDRLVDMLPDLISKDEALDVVSGVAGCIGVLLSLYPLRSSSDRLITIAQDCGRRVLELAQPMSIGIGWITVPDTPPLSGFAHGNAGIAWSLLKLYSVSGEEDFLKAAMDAIRYERTLFSEKDGNWRDVRRLDYMRQGYIVDGEKFLKAWCHGAPGIGMARLDMLNYLDDDEFRDEVEIALRTTLEYGHSSNHTLCHGDLGNLELGLGYSKFFCDNGVRVRVYKIASAIISHIEQNGWICGNSFGVETPGLMNGLAGIGYELLRLAEPDQVPSVLTLEPPLVL
jgi:type 2 lantibiotic biosynthesis protein LanM